GAEEWTRGALYHWSLWSGVCNESEIAEIINKRYDQVAVSPVVIYEINTGSGNVLVDSSGNNYHGTILGATWVWVDDPLNLDIVSDFRAKAHIGLKVETLPATDIGSKSMTLNGKLKGLGNYAGAECSFQYYPV